MVRYGDFDGEPLVETDFILRNIWAMTENYTMTTTNGSFDTDETRVLQGTGEVTFSDVGTFTSEGVALAYDFTGNFTRESPMLVSLLETEPGLVREPLKQRG